MLHICIFLSLTLGMAAADPQDLTGKMLVFPQETNTAHVKLMAPTKNLAAITVCLRYFTDLSRGTTFFSMSTPSFDNSFLIDKNADKDVMVVTVRNTLVAFHDQDFQRNRWQSVCATWESESGLVQLWLDGRPSSMKFSSNGNINENTIVVLGQEQDNFGGGFDREQSFVGMISDVHMWDSVLSPEHIENYSLKYNYPPGNVLDWKSIEFAISGKALVRNEQCQRVQWFPKWVVRQS